MPDPWGGDNMSDEYAPHTMRVPAPAPHIGPCVYCGSPHHNVEACPGRVPQPMPPSTLGRDQPKVLIPLKTAVTLILQYAEAAYFRKKIAFNAEVLEDSFRVISQEITHGKRLEEPAPVSTLFIADEVEAPDYEVPTNKELFRRFKLLEHDVNKLMREHGFAP